jgi:hypothetical protein
MAVAIEALILVADLGGSTMSACSIPRAATITGERESSVTIGNASKVANLATSNFVAAIPAPVTPRRG